MLKLILTYIGFHKMLFHFRMIQKKRKIIWLLKDITLNQVMSLLSIYDEDDDYDYRRARGQFQNCSLFRWKNFAGSLIIKPKIWSCDQKVLQVVNLKCTCSLTNNAFWIYINVFARISKVALTAIKLLFNHDNICYPV